MPPNHLSALPPSTNDFAIETSHALNTVRRVPSSPPKHAQKQKPLPPRPPREVGEEDGDGAVGRLTPPVPVKSPRRGFDSPEPGMGVGEGSGGGERGGVGAGREAEAARATTRSSDGSTQALAMQEMDQLPTSFYAPVLPAPACSEPRTTPESTGGGMGKWKITLQSVRLWLRVVVLVLVLVEMAISAMYWEGRKIDHVLVIVTPILLIYNVASFFMRSFDANRTRILLRFLFDFALAGGMMSAGVNVLRNLGYYDGYWWIDDDGRELTLARMLIAAGALQGVVWIVGVVEVGRKVEG